MSGAEVRDVALAAAEAGISVVPPRQNGTKAPITEKINGEDRWEQWQETPPTRDQIEAWYSDPRRTGVGFVGGAVSGGLELFEFEGRAAKAGIVSKFMTLARERGLGDLMELLCSGYSEKSAGGGLHLLYRCTETGCVKVAKTADGKDLIETKGEGGYMIVAPTNGTVHPRGGSWRMLAGGLDTIPTISPDQRRRLLELAAFFDQRPPPDDETPTAPRLTTVGGDGWVSQVIADYNSRTTWTEVLAGRFVHLHDRGGVGYWHYEGADNVVSATTNATGRDTLIVFSGTAEGAGWRIWEGHPKRKAPSYDRFSAHVLIETGRHDTDTRVEIARRLQAQGFRPPNLHVLAPPNVDADGVITSTDLVPWVPVLPDKFWEARPTTLGKIRQAAHSRQRSADAVFHTVLTRVSALAPHTLRIPPMVGSAKPLSYFVAIVAASGGGKSSANDIATELLPAFGDVLDQIPPGSGEGLAELLFDMVEDTDSCGKTIKVKKQVRHAAIVYIDEGQILGEIGGRKGATLLPSLRTIYTGGPLGQANANKERFRVVPGGSYVFGVSVGFQMSTAAVLLEDITAGTPQRFGWASAEDPTIERCDWPEALNWSPTNRNVAGQPLTFATEIEDEVRATDLAKNRREITPDPLDSHADLYRLKVAGLLAILDGRRNVTPDDWELAGIVRTTSNAVRTMVGNSVTAEAARRERATSAKLAQRAAHSDAAIHQRRVIDTARKIAGRVWDQTGPYLVSQMRRDVRRYPDGFDDAISHAVVEGWIVQATEPVVGAGGEKRLLRRGERRPT